MRSPGSPGAKLTAMAPRTVADPATLTTEIV